jgi:hypothetical protein
MYPMNLLGFDNIASSKDITQHMIHAFNQIVCWTVHDLRGEAK